MTARTIYNAPPRDTPTVVTVAEVAVSDLVVTAGLYGEVTDVEALPRELVLVSLRDDIDGRFAGAYILPATRTLSVRRLTNAAGPDA